jgi:regulator of protease activity HflC (stomatin/prohibitin superfamily)
MKRRWLWIAMLVLVAAMASGCTSKVVPPGTVVIVLSADGDVTIKKTGSYTAWGRDRVYFVDTRLSSFTEKMEILCADDINMTVDVKWVGSFDVSDASIEIIKSKVPAAKIADDSDQEGYRLSLSEFYKIAMKDFIRSTSRQTISPYVTELIPRNRKKIEGTIQNDVVKRFTDLGYPIQTASVLLSNLDYPPEVTKQRKAIKSAMLEDEKEAALAEARIAKAQREEDIAREEGKADIVRARTKAAQNMILSSSITPAILANKQWDALEQMSAGPNNQVFVLPYEALKGTGITAAVLNKSALDELIGKNAPLSDEEKAEREKERKALVEKYKKDAEARKEKYLKDQTQ